MSEDRKALVVVVALVSVVLLSLALVWNRTIGRAKVDAFARGYESGLADGLSAANTVPADPDVSCRRRVVELEDDLAMAGACEERLASYRRTEAVNRANARELGLDEGLRIGREDWLACGAWERERIR